MAAPTGGYCYQAVTPVGLARYLSPVQCSATCRALVELGCPHQLTTPLVRVGPAYGSIWHPGAAGPEPIPIALSESF